MSGAIQTMLDLDTKFSSLFAVCSQIGAPGRMFFKLIESSGHGAIWVILALVMNLMATTKGAQKFAFEFASGITVDLIVQGVLKMIFRRPRPKYDQKDMVLPSKVDTYSFPSGHASRFGYLTGFVFHYYTSTFPCVGIVLWTLLIVLSRLALGRHYVTDICAGLIIGYFEFVFVHAYDEILAKPF
eukprot:m.39780 g.39780  ORF g.39780 m.39780 type:complete len:185 (+) comp32813_c0_seq1:65-619(+)